MTSPDQHMQCMEVWGGNQPAQRSVVMPGLDAWVYSQPHGASEGGGDVYYLSACATGRIHRLLIADVSGHGQKVDALAIGLRGLMRRFVNHIDQLTFVRAMNGEFAALAREGRFATAVVSTFFAPTGRLTLCNAGHPEPLIYRAKTRQWSYLANNDKSRSSEPLNLPLGVMDLADYQVFDQMLDTGDLLICYTDSLIESHGPDGKMLGGPGLLDIIRRLDLSDVTQLIPRLLEAITRLAPNNLTADDVTVLLFRANGKGRGRPSLITQAIALGKLTASVGRRLFAGGPPIPWPDFKLPNVGGMLFPALHRRWKSPGK